MDLDIFYRLGLDEREIKLYTGLLKMGPCKAGTLSKLTSIDRSVTYKLLYLLIDKGFVSSVIRENRKYFQATDPSRLQDVLKEREEGLKEGIQFLEKLKRETKEETSVEVYKGKEGFKTVMNDLLKQKKNLYGIGYTAKGPEIVKYWYERWNRIRIKEKIYRKYLVSAETAKKEVTKRPLTTVKIMPAGFVSPSSTIVYGGNVAIFFPEKDDFTGIIIRSKRIAKAYKSFFDTLWKLSKNKAVSF